MWRRRQRSRSLGRAHTVNADGRCSRDLSAYTLFLRPRRELLHGLRQLRWVDRLLEVRIEARIQRQ